MINVYYRYLCGLAIVLLIGAGVFFFCILEAGYRTWAKSYCYASSMIYSLRGISILVSEELKKCNYI